MTTEELIDRLASHRMIGQAPQAELAWVAAHGTFRHFEAGEVVSRPTEVVDGLYIVLTGRMSISIARGTGRRNTMEWHAGDVTGLLPYSRMLTPPGETVTEEPTDVLSIAREDLPALARNCYEVTAVLVHEMTDRARRFTSTELRDEKMISLGKLAAGLAHELNNPASATIRDAKSLARALTASEEAAHAMCVAGLTTEQLAEVDSMRDFCLNPPNPRSTSGLELADREDAIAGWLQAYGVSANLAEQLAMTPITKDAVDRLAHALRGATLEAAIRWIASACAARSLAVDIERAAQRIHDLVAAVKGFTHMDRAPDEEPIDIAEGLVDTVAILEGKARTKSVSITLDVKPDLPPVRGLSVEINQVWMNLIDNAIDAAPHAGHVVVSASGNGRDLLVTVADDGPGIPPDIRGNIFDPFFTTKGVGEGTGLGLDIVRRIVHWHKGDVDVASHPGRTEFRVKLPVEGGMS